MKKEQKMTKNQPKRSRKVHVINAVKHFDNQFKKYLVTASTAAFAFLIALVWRDAIQESVTAFVTKVNIPLQQSYLYKTYMAIIITFICFIALIILSRWGAKMNKKAKK